MSETSGYLGLFVAAFVAATIIPAQSEAVLTALILTDNYSIAMLVLVASIANIAGSAMNWCLGRGLVRVRSRRWFPASEAQLSRATAWYAKYGLWSLLLSWVPFIGDPITIVAGILRTPFLSFILIVGFAKILRYIAVTAIAVNVL